MKRINLTIGFFAVFLLFTSDFYGLSDDEAVIFRAICIALGFSTIIISWSMGIHDYSQQQNKEFNLWGSLKARKPLLVTVTLLQAIGGVIGFLFFGGQSVFIDIWVGIAIASFPSFLIGLYVENTFNKSMLLGKNLQDKKLLLLFAVVSGILTISGLATL